APPHKGIARLTRGCMMSPFVKARGRRTERRPRPLRPEATLMGKTLERPSTDPEVVRNWKLADSVETYGIRHWGKGYFGVNRLGHVTVHPNKLPDEAIDLKLLIDELRDQDYNVPILIRFADILRHRV